MKEAKFARKGAVIRDLSSGEDKVWPSINAAKRESRTIQLKRDGALGRGSVKVVAKF